MPALNRTLGIPMLTFYGTGMILGAGIYSVIGKAAGLTNESLWISFVLASIVAILTGFSGAATAATVALAFAGYLNQFVDVSEAVVAPALLAVLTGVALMGIRNSGWANIIYIRSRTDHFFFFWF